MRDKISYLARKTKVYAKFFEWLNKRLAMFFVELNFKRYNAIQSVPKITAFFK